MGRHFGVALLTPISIVMLTDIQKEYYLDLVIRQKTITALFSLLYPTPRFY